MASDFAVKRAIEVAEQTMEHLRGSLAAARGDFDNSEIAHGFGRLQGAVEGAIADFRHITRILGKEQ